MCRNYNMGCKQSKKRCKICSTLNKNRKTYICEECIFIPTYITKFGRENLKRMINNSYQEFEKPVDLLTDESRLCRQKSMKRHKSRTTLTLHRPWPSAPPDECSIDNRGCNNSDCSCHERQSRIVPPAYPLY